MENGALKNHYVYGALTRLEQAVNAKGETALYTYNGLGHRVGKTIGAIHPEKKIQYTIDPTRSYHNLQQKEEDGNTQSYLWDGNVAAMEEEGHDSYYLQDDLGSPMLLADEEGEIRESYAFDEFGQSLHHTPEGQLQPFGYTGYQMETAGGLYFAQARRYDAGAGRFVSEDKISGFTALPHTMNRYSYCWNQPMEHVDLDGRLPQLILKLVEMLTNYVSNKTTTLADLISEMEEERQSADYNYTAAVYLVNRDGALGQGHAALLLLRDDGQAEFYSYAGRVNPGAITIGCEGYLSTHIEDGKPATISIEKFIEKKEVYADNVERPGENIGKADPYSNWVYIPITNDEGVAMHETALIIRCVPGRYNLWKHNCWQVAQIILRAGGKDFAKTRFAWWNTRPNSVYDNIAEEIERGDRPGWSYGTIEEMMLSEGLNEDSCAGGE